MGKKFNLKSGNCPSFKEMGGNSPFNQGFNLDWMGGKNSKDFFKDMIERFKQKRDEEGLKEANEMRKTTSQIGQASEIPGGHGSRSTRRFKETNEKLPEQDKV